MSLGIHTYINHMAEKKIHLIYKSLSENSATNILIFCVVLK